MESEYEELAYEDFGKLADIFNTKVEELHSLTDGDLLLREAIDNFISDVAVETKELLVRYSKVQYLNKLEVEDAQEQMRKMRHKVAKMKLSIKPIERAVHNFVVAGND